MIDLPSWQMIQTTITQCENLIDESGWGRPSRVFTMTVEGDTFYLAELPMDMTDNPALDLFLLAKCMLAGTGPVDDVLASLIGQRTVGWMLCQEVRTNQELSLLDHLVNNGVADHHATRRTRMLIGMDILGRVYAAIRQEGQTPAIMCEGPPPKMSGGLPIALRDLNIVVAQRMPNAAHYLKELAKVEIMTDDEIESYAMTGEPGGMSNTNIVDAGPNDRSKLADPDGRL